MLRWVIAALHLLALPLGLGGVWMRGRALQHADNPDSLRRAFAADNIWGLAAGLWIVTGLLRAFGGLEKGSSYYLHYPVFHIKLGLFLLVFILEVWPMVTLIRWRGSVRRGIPFDTSPAHAIVRISQTQAALIILIVFAATAMARGLFS